jgi:protein-ribulosamine 3-kinase
MTHAPKAQTHPLLTPAARDAIERAVSAYRGAPWRVRSLRDLADLSSHPAAIIADGDFAVFAKRCVGAMARDQLEVEQAGLTLLRERAGVQTPEPIAIIDVDGGAIMLTVAVAEIARGPEQWRAIGRTLARIHRVYSDACGLDRNGYFGPCFQDNRRLTDWPTFFLERRVWPRLAAAVDSGHLPPALARQVESVAARVHDLCGPPVAPTLLHGDAQKNNFLSTADGALVIDPAVHYGHPEYDLALIDYFEAVPDAVFHGYREVLPIAPDFAERRALWRIPACLAVVQHAGAPYLHMLATALAPYA